MAVAREEEGAGGGEEEEAARARQGEAGGGGGSGEHGERQGWDWESELSPLARAGACGQRRVEVEERRGEGGVGGGAARGVEWRGYGVFSRIWLDRVIAEHRPAPARGIFPVALTRTSLLQKLAWFK